MAQNSLNSAFSFSVSDRFSKITSGRGFRSLVSGIEDVTSHWWRQTSALGQCPILPWSSFYFVDPDGILLEFAATVRELRDPE